MKIIGFTYRAGAGECGWSVVLKGDSCLLNGRKPLFVPDWTQELCVTPCLVLRVSRLGKEISPRYADRYFDAVAPGADFVAMDLLRAAQAKGNSWTPAIAFDYSLAVGEYEPLPCPALEGRVFAGQELVMTPEEAVAEASKLMTIRQGDLIYIQTRQLPRRVEKEEIIRTIIHGEEKLYCKIK